MKFKHVVFAGAVSLALGPLAFAQYGADPQQPGAQAPPGGQPSPEAQPGVGAEPGTPMQDKETIRQAQDKLNQRGYSVGPADGTWGPQTEQALTQFQQAEGLEATGQLDQETLSALGIEEEEPPQAISPGMESEETPRGYRDR